MNPKPTADQGLVRTLNLSSVLHMIHSDAPLSRSNLAAETGLNKSTVSSLVEELLDRGLVTETGINSSGMGRPATLLEMNPKAGGIVGVELGCDFVSVVLTDFVGQILWRKQVSADPAASQEETLGQTQALIEEAVGISGGLTSRILGLSFAIPGTVDLEEGILIFAPNLSWRNIPLRKMFAASTGLRVYVENDANAAAIAEHLLGAAQQVQDFIFVHIGVGLGGGLFLNGRLYRGSDGFAGEIGHTHVMAEPINQLCRCGNLGCWETYANQDAIFHRVRSRWVTGQTSQIEGRLREPEQPLSLDILRQAAEAGDPDALGPLAETGKAIGNGLAHLVSVFNPEKVILGGPIRVVGEFLLDEVSESVNERTIPENVAETEVCLSALGSDASLMGAVAIVIGDILHHPTRVEREVVPEAVDART